MGGLERNKHASKKAGRGAVGKAAVVGMKERETKQVRAHVVEATTAEELQGFLRREVLAGSAVFTDDARAYQGLGDYFHESIAHGATGSTRTGSRASGPCSSAPTRTPSTSSP